VFVNGQNRFEDVLEILKNQPTDESRARFPFGAQLFADLKLIPTYYLRYYYDTARAIKEIQQAGQTRGEAVAEIEKQLLQQFKDSQLDIKPPELSQRGGALYSEAAFRLIFSLLSDRRDVQILIVRNQGAIKGLPDDASIEAPAMVGAHGVTPLTMTAPPEHVNDLIQAVKSSENLIIEAAVEGSRTKVVQAMLANPLVSGYDLARQVAGELIEAHQDYLPRFFAKGTL
jgi:6-phospho-beta-glucosidase